jgi:serine/threonine protein kinase/Flp pilus assembly protein TadD
MPLPSLLPGLGKRGARLPPLQRNRHRSRDPYRLVGTKLGRFLIIELIGIGGMGVVYHARNEFDEKSKYALKILKPDLALEYPELAISFFEEARSTATLKHPGIVKVHHIDIDEEQNLPFFIMEWLDGITLDRELQSQKRMSLERVTVLLEEICQAVHYAHERGFVHRDLKPSNIMLTKDYQGREQVKILDFGIAKSLDSTLEAANSRVVGAPHYASPEQLNVGAKIDCRSDVYSLGVTVYQLLTGELPFNSDSISVIINQHLTEPPPPLRTLLPETPIAVEQAVQRAMMKRPEDRYRDILDFARTFRQAVGLESGGLILSIVNSQTGRAIHNASVYLGRQYLGNTDEQGQFRAEGLNPNKYLLRIEARQYQSLEEYVSIGPNEHEMIRWELSPKNVGELILKTNVRDAEVVLNGELAGMTDPAGILHLHNVSASVVGVEVRHKKYLPYVVETEVFQGQSSQLELKLTKLPSWLSRLWQMLRSALIKIRGGRLKLAVYILIGALLLVSVIGISRIYLDTTEFDELAASLTRAQGLKAEGDAAFGSGKYAAAAALYQEACNLAPHNIEYRKSLGDALLKSNDYQKSEEAYREIVRLIPENAQYHYLLGEALLSQNGKQREAALAFYEAVRLKPQEAVYHYGLGNALMKLDGGSRCAEFEYRTAIRLDPDKAEYYYRRGLSLYFIGDYKGAALNHKTALEMGSSDPNWDKLRGEIESNYNSAADGARGQFRTIDLAAQPCDVK